MASKLEAALAWAARGLRVFPLQENSKLPLDQGWTLAATTDPDVIRSTWLDPVVGSERDYNVGFLTSQHVVLDVDTKAGKPGLATMMGLDLDFDTLTTRTPTGGYHLIFGAIGREVGQAPLGAGIDVRSHNGYVVAPGSTIDGVPYVLELDLPVAEFPHHLRPLLKAPRSRRNSAGVSVELDQPEAIELAAHWLRREAPVAVQGENGDDCAYRVCCRLRDLGVSETTALDLLLDCWNERCDPPWSAGELQLKIENAGRYATGEAGSASPAALFDCVVDVPAPNAAAHDTISMPIGDRNFGNAMNEGEIIARPWVIEGMLMRTSVSVLAAPSGAGKSLLSLIVGAHLAVGKPLWGLPIKEPGFSVIYNAEDNREEVSRRLIIVCRSYGIDYRKAADKMWLLGRDDIKLKLTKQTPPVRNEEHINFLKQAARGVSMLSMDPMVSYHTARENDVTEMEFVMDIMREVAAEVRVPVLGVQHTAKQNGEKTSLAGDQDAARGSSAIPAAARVMMTMFRPTAAECVEIGVPVADRKGYVRLDGAKASYARVQNGPQWLRWESHSIASGDSVGVLVPHDPAVTRGAETLRLGEIIVRMLRAEGRAAMPLATAVERITASGMGIGKAAGGDLEQRLVRSFTEPFPVEGARVALRTNPEGLGRGQFVVLC